MQLKLFDTLLETYTKNLIFDPEVIGDILRL